MFFFIIFLFISFDICDEMLILSLFIINIVFFEVFCGKNVESFVDLILMLLIFIFFSFFFKRCFVIGFL